MFNPLSTLFKEILLFSSQNIEPTNKNYMLALDVSGSMTCGCVCGAQTISPRVASAAMAMVTARTEQGYEFVGFSHSLIKLEINSTMSLNEVIETIERVSVLFVLQNCSYWF